MSRSILPFSGLFKCLILTSVLLNAQQAHVNLDWNPQKNTDNLTPYGANLISPIVNDDGMVTFYINAPEANEVSVTGGPLMTALGGGRSIPMERDNEGLWSVTVGPIAPDMYIYKLIIDGVTVPDPNNTLAGYADQPGYSILVVHGNEPAYYDARPVPHGTVVRHIYHSDVTNGEREMYVYLPPGYDPSHQYPVLYLTGGSGELASNWAQDGRANFIMDNLLAENRVVPMIIAMPNNQMIHRRYPNHSAYTFELFEAELREHIIPLIDNTYSTIRNPHGRALAGLSMGGRHAQRIGFESLDLFASFGILSAGDVNSETVSADFLNDPQVSEKVDYIFVGQGTEEASPGNRTEALHVALTDHNIAHEYYVGGHGAHDWATWRHLLYARFLPGLWRM